MKRRSGFQLMRARDPRSLNDREDWEQARLIAFRMVVGCWPTVPRLPDPEEWERGQPKPESWEILDEVGREALTLLCRTDRDRTADHIETLEYAMREDAQLIGVDWSEEFARIIQVIPKHFRAIVSRAYTEGRPLDRTTAGILARAMFSAVLTDDLPNETWARAIMDAMLI